MNKESMEIYGVHRIVVKDYTSTNFQILFFREMKTKQWLIEKFHIIFAENATSELIRQKTEFLLLNCYFLRALFGAVYFMQ